MTTLAVFLPGQLGDDAVLGPSSRWEAPARTPWSPAPSSASPSAKLAPTTGMPWVTGPARPGIGGSDARGVRDDQRLALRGVALVEDDDGLGAGLFGVVGLRPEEAGAALDEGDVGVAAPVDAGEVRRLAAAGRDRVLALVQVDVDRDHVALDGPGAAAGEGARLVLGLDRRELPAAPPGTGSRTRPGRASPRTRRPAAGRRRSRRCRRSPPCRRRGCPGRTGRRSCPRCSAAPAGAPGRPRASRTRGACRRCCCCGSRTRRPGAASAPEAGSIRATSKAPLPTARPRAALLLHRASSVDRPSRSPSSRPTDGVDRRRLSGFRSRNCGPSHTGRTGAWRTRTWRVPVARRGSERRRPGSAGFQAMSRDSADSDDATC